MATSVVPPSAATAAPTSLDSAIDALPVVGVESTPDTSTETEATPPSLDTPGETPQQETQPEAADADDKNTGQPAEDEEFDPGEEIKADRVSDDGKEYFFRAPKAKAMLQALDFRRQLDSAIPNASVEQLQENYQRAVGLDALLADYDSADPQRVGNVVESLLSTARSPEASATFADQTMAYVARTNPQLFQTIESKVMNGYTQRLYNEAMRTGDQGLLKLAQNLDYKQRGQFRSVDQIQQQDPLAEERARFDQERQQFYSLRQQEAQRSAESAAQEARESADSAISEEISRAIPPQVSDAIKASPGGEIHLRHITRDLRDAVDDARKANPTWDRQFQLAVDRLRTNPSAEAKQAVVTMMRQFAAPIIARNRNAVIKAVTGRILSENAAAHAKQQQLSQKKELGGTTAPVRRAGLKQQLQQMKAQGKSVEDAMDMVFGSLG